MNSVRSRSTVLRLTVAATLALSIGVGGSQTLPNSSLASFDAAWQTIEETYYDPTFGGLDWAGIRAELRPRAEAASSPDGVRAVIREMLARLKQSHFVLLSSSSEDALPGDAAVEIEVRVNGSGVVVTRVAPAVVPMCSCACSNPCTISAPTLIQSLSIANSLSRRASIIFPF